MGEKGEELKIEVLVALNIIDPPIYLFVKVDPFTCSVPQWGCGYSETLACCWRHHSSQDSARVRQR